MEDNKEINKFLSDNMSLDNLSVEQPSILLVEAARKKIIARQKPQKGEIEDFFSLVAAFLNLKIKLYHAVVATVIIGACMMYFNKEEKTNTAEVRSNDLVSNLAAAKNSTVLSSISTFGLNKERTYASESN
ncbi:MAG: hypothetical protein JNJ40_04690 [Bacteroidia bacterium]|nr:hypothetical protein [Bacteroidia bacterium]